MGNDRGAKPAALVPPDYQALETTDKSSERFEFASWLRSIGAAAAELTRTGEEMLEAESAEQDEGAEIEIEHIYRQKLMGARCLPRRERAAARRAAREWRAFALKALHEKRASMRHARHMRRRSRVLTPS